MKKHFLIILFCIPLRTVVHAQDARDENWKRDSASVNITLFEDNKDGSVYTGMYEILKGIQPISFAGVAFFKGRNRPYRLVDGEGKNGYVFEANMDQVFTLMQGRNGSSDFWQRARLAFRYAPAFRMANDSSLPLIPANQKVGIEYSYVLWNNYTRRDSIKIDPFHYARDQDWINQTNSLKVVHLIFHAMHYSNGQPPGVYYRTIPVKRHDYKKGDFSTNFLSLMAVYSIYTKEHRLFSAGGGLRLDGGIGDALSFNEAQEKRYGKRRLLALLQYRSKPIWFGKLIPWTDLQTGRQYALRNKLSFRHRIEADYIIGNLDSFDRTKKYRLGIHYYCELDFAKARTTGIIFHLYHGRDYLNIRYDDIVTGVNIGFSFSLAKYKPPRQKSSAFIYEPAVIRFNTEKRKDQIVN
jgi:hypothetical protein